MKHGDFTVRHEDFTMKHGDFTVKNGDFIIKHDGFSMNKWGVDLQKWRFHHENMVILVRRNDMKMMILPSRNDDFTIKRVIKVTERLHFNETTMEFTSK